MELTIIIPALNEEKNVEKIIPLIRESIYPIVSSAEIIVVDGGSSDKTRDVAASLGARVIVQKSRGYGGALSEGFASASGKYILTMDADLSHSPTFFTEMWDAIKNAEVVIASRYIPGGRATMPLFRKLLSRILNIFFTRGLSFPLKDISSGFRLYKTDLLKQMHLQSADFDVLEEIIIKIYSEGYKIREIPFHYSPRSWGKSNAKLLKFAIAYLRTFYRMWKLRNSILSADYDERAYDSIIPLQRYWQRRRRCIVTNFAENAERSLDIGCGSSRIFPSLRKPIGLDIKINRLRYMRKYGKPLVNATIFQLPFKDDSFDTIVCSEVIEHIAASEQPFIEMNRILKKGGKIILGTPDYGRLLWIVTEKLYRFFAPGGYADEHITHYSFRSLSLLMKKLGYVIEDVKYVFQSEMIFLFKKIS